MFDFFTICSKAPPLVCSLIPDLVDRNYCMVSGVSYYPRVYMWCRGVHQDQLLCWRETSVGEDVVHLSSAGARRGCGA